MLLMGKSRWYCEQRCRSCFHSSGFDLPDIKKKIVYLDQFAISKMMKAINIDHPSNQKEELCLWKDVFNLVDKLLHYQLIICPYSTLHEDESILANKNYTQDFQSLKKMYKHIWQWKYFPHTEEIERIQYYNWFKNFLWDKVSLSDWEVNSMMDNFHEWSNSVYLSVESWYLEKIMDDIDADKNNLHDAIIRVYENEWTKVKKPFQELYNLEMRAHGSNIYYWYVRALENLQKINDWILEVSSVMWSILSKEKHLFHLFYDLLSKIGVNDNLKQIEIIAQFLLISDLSGIDFVNIESTLWAWVADLSYKNNISRKQINAWMNNDISAIAHYLPYCDIMMVDWVIDNLLKQKSVKERLVQYNLEFFTERNGWLADFKKYLEWIYDTMTIQHKDIVEKSILNELQTIYNFI
jgi:hypothetical protein